MQLHTTACVVARLTPRLPRVAERPSRQLTAPMMIPKKNVFARPLVKSLTWTRSGMLAR